MAEPGSPYARTFLGGTVASVTHGAGDVQLFDRSAPIYDLVMPSVDPDALETAFDCADRDVERVADIDGSSGRATFTLDVSEQTVLDCSAGTSYQARGQDLDCARGDAWRLSFADDSLDAVAVADIFHHMPNQRGVVEEVFRVPTSGGAFAVDEFDPGMLLGQGLAATERAVGFGSALTMPDELVRFLERIGSEAAVVEHGFEYTMVRKKRKSH